MYFSKNITNEKAKKDLKEKGGKQREEKKNQKVLSFFSTNHHPKGRVYIKLKIWDLKVKKKKNQDPSALRWKVWGLRVNISLILLFGLHCTFWSWNYDMIQLLIIKQFKPNRSFNHDIFGLCLSIGALICPALDLGEGGKSQIMPSRVRSGRLLVHLYLPKSQIHISGFKLLTRQSQIKLNFSTFPFYHLEMCSGGVF